MAREMLINVSEGEECRIAIVEDDKLEELYMERTSSTSHVGNIYKGRVTNVEPSIQAAFVDFGMGRNGFLHISDLMPQYFGRKGDDFQESVGRKIARRDRPPIQRCLRRGDDIIVQIIKEGIGTKGPTLSTYVSIPGRILVMMPGMSKFGVSRKIEDEVERKRLRTILDGLKPRNDVGFIIRTAGIGKTKTEIQRDLQYLTRLWITMQKKLKQPAPQELYTEGDLVTRTVRDVFSSDIERITVDHKDVAKRIKEFFKIAMPRTRNKVELYEEPIPLFHKYKMESEIERMYSRHVPLPSGGSLVIDSTEAIVAIDVNSGKFRDHADAETTAFRTDMEAADEIPRQLRLRDLGGVIICDFIDLRYERHRRELERKLHDNLRKDRAKTKVLRMSQFGIIEMTRQRMRPSLKRSIYSDCPHCRGSGLVKTSESMSLDVMRRLAIAANNGRVSRVELSVSPEVAFYLLNKKRAQIAELEDGTQKRITVRADAQLGLDELKMDLFDARDGLVFIEELGMVSGAQPGTGQHERHRRHQQPTAQRTTDKSVRPRGAREVHPPARHDEAAEEAIDEREAAESAISVLEPQQEVEPVSKGRGARRRVVPRGENVVDVEEGTEPMGEAPRGIDDQPDEDGSARRRRRRGRRGRGGRGKPAGIADGRSTVAVEGGGDEEVESAAKKPHVEAPEQPKPAVSPTAAEGGGESGEESEGVARRRRRRRGGRRHRRRKGNGQVEGAGSETTNGEADVVAPVSRGVTAQSQPLEPSRPSAQRVPPPRPAAAPIPAVKTGSTDRHLRDEPVLPEVASRRPRTYRELDDIADDFE